MGWEAAGRGFDRTAPPAARAQPCPESVTSRFAESADPFPWPSACVWTAGLGAGTAGDCGAGGPATTLDRQRAQPTWVLAATSDQLAASAPQAGQHTGANMPAGSSHSSTSGKRRAPRSTSTGRRRAGTHSRCSRYGRISCRGVYFSSISASRRFSSARTLSIRAANSACRSGEALAWRRVSEASASA